MKLSCHEMMLGDRPLAEKFSLARDGGFDGLDLRGDLLHDQVAAAARLVQDTGLPVPTVYGRLHPSLVAKTLAERAAALAVVRERLRDAEQVGAQQLIVVPIFGAAQITIQRGGGNEELEEALLLILLDELADEAGQRGVAIVLEPLNRHQTHLLTSPRKAARLTRRLGDAIGTMVDTYHMDVEDQDSADEIEGAFDQVRLVHLSDRERKLPGTGGLDFAPGLRKLQSHGFAGWYGFECAGPFTVPQLRASVEYMRGSVDPPT